MALAGPEGLTPDEIADADHAAQVQAEYFDRFHREVLENPPVELAPPVAGPPLPTIPGVVFVPAEPSGMALKEPMTAAEFAARAELYAGSAWVTAQNMNRNAVVRGGRAAKEARFHLMDGPPEDHACAICLGESEKGWVPINTLLPVGDSICLGCRCDCYFSYMMSDGSIFITSRGWERAA
jgi:hypothetical protein